MEYWDLLDKNKKAVGKRHLRGETVPEGFYHLVVHCWVKKGDYYLLDRRSADRPFYAGLWECSGGSVLAGESGIDGAIREAHEEVGISLLKEKGKLIYSWRRDEEGGIPFRDFVDVYLFETAEDYDLDAAETPEVSEAKWVKKETVIQLIEDGEAVPSIAYVKEVLP